MYPFSHGLSGSMHGVLIPSSVSSCSSRQISPGLGGRRLKAGEVKGYGKHYTQVQIEKIEKNHYAIVRHKLTHGLFCNACAIIDANRKVIAVVSISGLRVRMTNQRLKSSVARF